MRISRTILIAAFSSAIVCPGLSGLAADVEVPATEPATTQPLSRTVGIDIIKKTVNPDGSFTLLFQWKDKDKNLISRSVIVNDGTVIGIDGELKTMADVTDEVLKKKAVATVGLDMVTAVNLRFGRAMVAVSKDQLTPAQLLALEAAAPPITPKSNESIDNRAEGIVSSLQLNDSAKEARLKEVLVTDLRAVRDAHNAGFAPEKSVREKFNAGLAADLTPEQIDTVKDKLTVNKVPVTFKVYHQIVPNLTPADDAKILDLLKQAREKCLDVKNPDEMAEVFKPFKEQIQTYLTANGHDWDTLYKQFVDSQRNGSSAASSQPAK